MASTTRTPRAHLVRSSKNGIAYDQIPQDAPVRRWYESEELTRFIATVLDKPVQHPDMRLNDLTSELFYGRTSTLNEV